MTGKGFVILHGTAEPLRHIAEVTLNPNLTYTDWEDSISFDKDGLCVGRDFKATIAFKGITASLLNKFIGGTLTAGTANSEKYIAESKIVSESPYTVTLSQTPISTSTRNTLIVYAKASTGVRTYYEEVSATPTGYQYTQSGTTLTFPAASEGDTVYAEYIYNGSSDATQIAFGPDSALPGSFGWTAVLKMLDTAGNTKYFSINSATSTVNSVEGFPGANDTSVKDFTVGLDVKVQAANDLVLLFED